MSLKKTALHGFRMVVGLRGLEVHVVKILEIWIVLGSY